MEHTTASQLFDGHLKRFARHAVLGDREDCWTWTGMMDRHGYGRCQARQDGKRAEIGAHRLAYLILRGPIEPGLVLDHLCRNRACVNPWHLEPVTNGENIRRGDRQLHDFCRSGRHRMTPDNIGVTGFAEKRRRHCKACRAEWIAIHGHG